MPNGLTDFDIVNFPYLNGTVPNAILYDVISQLSSYSFARASRQDFAIFYCLKLHQEIKVMFRASKTDP